MLRGKGVFLPFPVSRGHLQSQARGHFLHLQSQKDSIFSPLITLSYLNCYSDLYIPIYKKAKVNAKKYICKSQSYVMTCESLMSFWASPSVFCLWRTSLCFPRTWSPYSFKLAKILVFDFSCSVAEHITMGLNSYPSPLRFCCCLTSSTCSVCLKTFSFLN